MTRIAARRPAEEAGGPRRHAGAGRMVGCDEPLGSVVETYGHSYEPTY